MPADLAIAPLATAAPAFVDPGARIYVRPMTSQDGPVVRSLLEGLSDMSRYLRFLSPMPVIPDRIVEAIVDVGEDHLGRIAMLDGACIGEATLHRAAPGADRGELGVTVAADHRRRGLATRLCRALASDALMAGINTFDVVVSPANLPSRAMLRSLGGRATFSDGVIEGSVSVAALLGAAS